MVISINPAISADGRYVAFRSHASNLVSGDTNNLDDIFVRDRQNGTTERISVAYDESKANGVSNYPSLSADGRFVAFNSMHPICLVLVWIPILGTMFSCATAC